MVAPVNKLQDSLLPEVELCIVPYKLSENVRVDLHRLDEDFINFLVQHKHIIDDVHNDVQIMSMSKVPKFCQLIRDAYCSYNIGSNADI